MFFALHQLCNADEWQADLSLLSMARESKDAIVKLLLLCAVTLDESGSIWASSAGYLPRADVGAMEVVAELGRIAEAGGQDPCQIHLPFQELEMILPHELDGKDGHARPSPDRFAVQSG